MLLISSGVKLLFPLRCLELVPKHAQLRFKVSSVSSSFLGCLPISTCFGSSKLYAMMPHPNKITAFWLYSIPCTAYTGRFIKEKANPHGSHTVWFHYFKIHIPQSLYLLYSLSTAFTLVCPGYNCFYINPI